MSTDRSTFLGPRLRRLRRGLGLTQAAMAKDLDVSASYIALIERNHRPLSAELLIRLAEIYDIEIAAFAGAEDRTVSQLQAALGDPVFSNFSIEREDIRDLTATNPALGDAVAALYGAYRASQNAVMEARAGGDVANDPLEEAREFISRERNYFPALDQAGEETAIALGAKKTGQYEALAQRFQDRHGLKVRVLPDDIMVGAYRRNDRHRKQVMVSELLDHASRVFQLSLQLALLEGEELLDEAVSRAAFETDAGKRLTRAALANYYAAAIMLPYGKFRRSAEELQYDVEALGRRFGASFEQVCHRLTTLQKTGEEGIPFFFLRFDAAGNVSKRFSGGVFPFARYGGSCPIWNIHQTFRTPRKILTQFVQLPDGGTYFSIARTVHGGVGGFGAQSAERAVALGCDSKYADRLIYAQHRTPDAVAHAEIGVTCRLCSRPACAARAHPPLERRLIIDEYRRFAAPFSFAFD
ncbi:short-chain fatty acyl-CoA regulator family protein [Hyphococcus flavus]|uniref:Short-chain fatty acyl-CoA regulator family protein n=1 Tax=Hyphococcus flavus TaxID=1866326 RepID=A0AAF0CFM1_9PROT|nr:helix-turn-helix transcriptional regulator [Hyphococcus flavus]WDI32606.1 short-chain fatty acyl-CoA regulator family protein [Hyphococcus flavus]